MNRVPIAYTRRSRVDADSTGDVSRDVQLTAIRRIAGDDGRAEEETAGREDLGRGGRYWDAGWNWIAAERAKGAKP
jgi:hypothetical protein